MAVLPVNSSRHALGSLLFASAPPLHRRIVLRLLRRRSHRVPETMAEFQGLLLALEQECSVLDMVPDRK